MGGWLWVCDAADVVPFIEAFRKMTEHYYPDKIDVCKDAVSISNISMTYVLNKSLEKTKGSSYIHQGVFVTYVKIYEKSSSAEVVMVNCKISKGSFKRKSFWVCTG